MKKPTKKSPYKKLTVKYVTQPVRKVNDIPLDTVIEVILPDNGYTAFLHRVAAIEKHAKLNGDEIMAPLANFVYEDTCESSKKSGCEGVLYVDAFSIGIYVTLMEEYLRLKKGDAFAQFLIDLLTDHCNRQIPMEEQEYLARALGI